MTKEYVGQRTLDMPQHHTSENDNKCEIVQTLIVHERLNNGEEQDYGCHRLRWPALRVRGRVGVSSTDGSVRNNTSEDPAS